MLSLFKRDIKIVWLAANPKDTHVLKLTKELRAIEEVIRPYNRSFELKPILETRSKDFLQAILAEQPTILHFSGHATTEGICLQDDNDLVQLVAGKDLATVLSDCPSLQCVILNACYSEAQALSISQTIPFVIGMQDKLRDESGINFSFGFYSALVAGKSIEKAYDYGVVAMNMENTKQFSMQRTLIIQTKENTFDKAVLLKNLTIKEKFHEMITKYLLLLLLIGGCLGIGLKLATVFFKDDSIQELSQDIPQPYIQVKGRIFEELKHDKGIPDATVKFSELCNLKSSATTTSNMHGEFIYKCTNNLNYINTSTIEVLVEHPDYESDKDIIPMGAYMQFWLKRKSAN